MNGSSLPDKLKKSGQLLSMTGYGAARKVVAGVELDVVLRSVNSRFLDLIFKLPDNYLSLEGKLRELLQNKLSRGRIEIFIKRNVLNSAALSNSVNSAWIAGMQQVYQIQAEAHGCYDDDFKKRALLQLLRAREAFGESAGTVNPEEQSLLSELLESAANDLVSMRAREGMNLRQQLVEHSAKLSEIQKSISASQDDLHTRLRSRLFERLKNLLDEGSLDPQRLTLEAALLAERADISEELSRLNSHLEQFKENLERQSQGKKLEFITQEIGREINTIGSKVQNSAIQSLVIEAKSHLEKIREQCANVE